jgi:hypothetical protein
LPGKKVMGLFLFSGAAPRWFDLKILSGGVMQKKGILHEVISDAWPTASEMLTASYSRYISIGDYLTL